MILCDVETDLFVHLFQIMQRAHEAHADGVAVSKGGKVFTIFSTSKDHNQGNKAMAGCILVDFENLQVINRSHAYRNVYIHRRDSVSIEKLSNSEIEERMRLGLVTDHQNDDNEEYEDDEEWEDMQTEDQSDEEDDEEFEYEDVKFSSRRSSVIPEDTMASPPGSSNDENRWRSFDFSNVETSDRKEKKKCPRFSSMGKIEEDADEDKEMDFDEEKKHNGVQYTY